MSLYSEHLSYCSDDGHLYDLMPIPFTEEAVRHIAAHIRQAQDALGRRIAVENVSYYAAPYQAMAEADFVTAVLDEAGCDLLLDVNNVFVNAINHGYDARAFLARMPSVRIASYHIAGHYDEADDLKVDTHGAPVKDDVGCWRRPMPPMVCAPPCWNAISISRRWPNCARSCSVSATCRRCMRTARRPRPRMADALHEQQFALSRHLRDPSPHPPPPGLEARRLAIYRDLFFNNIEGLLAGNFPVIRRTLGNDAWPALVRRFYADHRSQTPLFPEIAREFIRYLESQDDALPPWLRELAHYEWVELALQIAEGAIPLHAPDGDLLAGEPLVSPFAWALAYQWPVHRIGPDFQPDAPPAEPTCCWSGAMPATRCAAISPLVYRLVELLGEGGRSGGDVLRQLAMEARVDDVPAFVDQGAAMFSRMREEGTLLGTVPGPLTPVGAT